jgi:NAD(P)-dependent dehydrogenase (short-subunit alcohol dehydrogenase family)
MKKKVLITGSTGSIGRATAMELAKNNCHVILLGRHPGKLDSVKSELIQVTGNSDIEAYVADLSESESIRKAVAEIKGIHSSLDALVNVAAIFKNQRVENSKGYEYMFASNHLGPFILTNELLGLLKSGKPSRVLTVSAPSTTKIRFDDLPGLKKFSGGFLGAFGSSKMMNLMFTYALARRLADTGVTANVFHPGLVKSDLLKESPAIMYRFFKLVSAKPDRAAKMLCSLALDSRYETSGGKFFRYDGKEIKSSKYSHDEELQDKLWSLSEQLSSL